MYACIFISIWYSKIILLKIHLFLKHPLCLYHHETSTGRTCVNISTFLNVMICRRRLRQIVVFINTKWLPSNIFGKRWGEGPSQTLGTTVWFCKARGQSTKTWRCCYLSLPLSSPHHQQTQNKTKTKKTNQPNKQNKN